MFTVCPKCSLKLVVTAADLRVAQGYVRCGRCADVFNALAGLSDEEQAALAEESSPPASATPRPPQPRAPEPRTPEPQAPKPRPAQPRAPERRAEERAREPQPPAAAPSAAAPIPDSSLEFDPSSTDVSQIFIEPDLGPDSPTGTFESIVLATEELPAEELAPLSQTLQAEPVDERQELEIELEELRVELDSSALAQQAPSLRAEPVAAAEHDAQAAPASLDILPPATAAEFSLPDSLASDLEAIESGARRARMLRAAASVLLALALAAQIVHHYRAALAEVSWLGPPLGAIYARLGLPIAPRWDVSAYEVRQLGAVAGPQNPGTLTVRASIKNNARRAQPLPLLRVTVQDRFGNRVAARDVPPRDYLPETRAAHALLGAGQRIDAELAFVDPGPKVVGFEIDACLRDSAGRIACAHDAGASSGD